MRIQCRHNASVCFTDRHLEVHNTCVSFPTMTPDLRSKNKDFKSFLVDEFSKRNKQNPKYSLRAFAFAIGIDNSRLSKIFRNKRPISHQLIKKIGAKLKLPKDEISLFCTQHDACSESGQLEFFNLSIDHFEIIENWHHYALLEMMKLKEFRPCTQYLAEKLNATKEDIELCIERLESTGLLKIDENGTWKDLTEGFSSHIIDENFTSIAHRSSQKEILNMASVAIDQPIEYRDQSSMMMATSKKKITEVKEKIRQFRREMCAFLEDCDEKDSIYQLSVSLYPLIEEGK